MRIEGHELLAALAENSSVGSGAFVARADDGALVVVELAGEAGVRRARRSMKAVHPALARVVSVVAAPDGAPLVVTEYVDGDTLSACLAVARRRAGAGPGTAPPAAALLVARAVLAALDVVHRFGVHGLVSPDTIVLSRRGEVKLAHGSFRDASDLGVALAYASPEQARGEAASPETDVFGVGAALHRMLVGRGPYEGRTERETRERLASGAEPAIPEGGSRAIRALLVRALGARREDRFRSAAAMLAAVDSIIAAEASGSTELAAFCEANASDRARATLARVTQAEAVARSSRSSGAPATVATHATIAARTVVDPHDPAFTSGPAPAPQPSPAVVGMPPPEMPAGEFFDVKGLAQRASTPKLPGSEGVAPPEGIADVPLGLADERSGLREAPPPPRLPWRPIASGVAALVVLGGAFVALPGILQRHAVAAADDAGVTLTIGHVSLGLGTARFTDVHAVRMGAKDVAVSADEVVVEGFDARRIVVRGAVVELEGPPDAVLPELTALAARLRGGKENARLVGTRQVSVPSLSLAWTHAAGPGSRLAATNGSAELVVPRSSARPAEGTAHAARLEIETPQLHLGPWSASFETADVTSRLHIALDPPVADGPSILVLGGAEGAGELTVRIPRSPLGRLGVRPEELGLQGGASTDVEVTLDAKAPAGGGRREGKATLALFGARAGRLGPLDVRVNASASGPAGGALVLDHTNVTAGPFVAAVDGTVTPHALGALVDASFRAQPVPCAHFVKAEVKTWGPLAAALQDMLHQTDVARVSGTAQASGTVRWDVTQGRPVVELTTKDTCGLSLFEPSGLGKGG